MADDRGMLHADETADVKDDDFVSESFSAPNAFEPAPEDTTSAPLEAEADQATETSEAPDTTQAGDVVEIDEGHVSASRDAVAEKKAAAATSQPAKSKPKNKVPLEKRTTQLKHEVDQRTYQLRETERKLADLNRQVADTEARLRTQAPSKATETTATDPADAPMPDHPQYRDFETDEAYEAATAKWKTDVVAWNKAQQDRLERRITQGVEARFRDAGSDAAAQAAEQRLVATLDKVRTGKTDWNERVTALKDVTSAWYDPETHGDATTPFLSDLARTRLAMGLEDGGELLYWLGEDPDRAQVLADLFPNRPIRDAIVHAPSILPLLEHFATDAGQAEFEALKSMHPLRVNQAIGALSVRLADASRGSLAPSHPITKAHPSARPPAGTPGARGSTTSVAPEKQSFTDWMAAEDAKEQKERERLAGVSAR